VEVKTGFAQITSLNMADVLWAFKLEGPVVKSATPLPPQLLTRCGANPASLLAKSPHSVPTNMEAFPYKEFFPEMANEILAETSEQLQHTTWLNIESLSYNLH
jgi:hypothetical protein